MGFLDSIIDSIAGEGASGKPAPKERSPYETQTVVLNMRDTLFGKPSRDAKRLERLIGMGWEVVTQVGAPHGARTTTYTLRRARR